MKSILITGCSSGIGYSAARALKTRGYQVFATARHPEDVEQLQREGFEAHPLDLSDSTSIQNAVSWVLEKTGGTLDGLFNNGAYGQPGAVEDLTRDTLRKQFETNLFGTHELTCLVLKAMRQQGHGRIIQNSSVLGLITLKYYQAFLDNIDTENSVHKQVYTAVKNRLGKTTEQRKQDPFTLGPEAVVDKLIHALESKKPKARYYVTFPTYLFAILRRILPTSILDKILCRVSDDENK